MTESIGSKKVSETDLFGVQRHYENGVLHRLDGPAVKWPDGSTHWYRDGKLHREDGPAMEYRDGYKAWCRDGKYHRINGPAIINSSGDEFWYKNGNLQSGPEIYGDWLKEGF
jgi:hypothetical protein